MRIQYDIIYLACIYVSNQIKILLVDNEPKIELHT